MKKEDFYTLLGDIDERIVRKEEKPYRKRRTQKKLLLGIAAVLVLLMGMSVFTFLGKKPGVHRVFAEKTDSAYALTLTYFGSGQIRAEKIGETEELFVDGEQATANDGSLGKNVYLILLTDLPHGDFRYIHSEVSTFEEVPRELKGKLNIRRATIPDDSTWGFYLGSDEPLVFADTKTQELPASGKISLSFTVG